MWTIKKTANLFGITSNKLRFYEEKGLIQPMRNPENGYRCYNDADLLKIQLILGYRELGFSIEAIENIFTQNDAQSIENQMFNQWQAINRKIKQLTRQQKFLGNLLDSFYVSNQITFEEDLIRETKKLNELSSQQDDWQDVWHFDDWALTYDEDVQLLDDPLKLFQDYDTVLNTIVEKLQREVSKNSQLLDIGVGTGNLAARLIEAGYSVKGVDQSRAMLQTCKRKHPNMKVYLGDFLNLPFEQGSFDCVVSSYTFHHLNEAEKVAALVEVMRVLKSGGAVYLADFMYRNEVAKDMAYAGYSKEQKAEASDEYFGLVSHIEDWAKAHQRNITYEQLNELVWIVKIGGTLIE